MIVKQKPFEHYKCPNEACGRVRTKKNRCQNRYEGKTGYELQREESQGNSGSKI